MTSKITRAFCAFFVLGVLSVANAGTTTFGPSAYLQTGDTPDGFFCAECVGWIEDFELGGGAFDSFITLSDGTFQGPNGFSGLMNSVTDSVDGDDGSVDGFGNGGSSWFVDGTAVTISFATTVKNAGLVITDGDRVSTDFVLEAFDSMGASLAVINSGDIADDTFTGETAEDTFLGFQDMDAQIASMTLTMVGGTGLEIDHIHWQEACVPEPSSALIAALGFLGLLGFRRR